MLFSTLTSVLYLTLYTVIAGAEPLPKNSDTLVMLHVLFRHGNRTPDKASLFPNDLHINHTYEPHGYSQLTKTGKKREYEIGRYIREYYDEFIPDQYTPDIVYALTTNTKRTKMSLQLVLASLYPPQLSDLFTIGLIWQPIPYDIELGGGLIGVPLAYCPIYLNLFYKYVLSKKAQEIIAGYKTLYEELSRNAGFDVLTPKDVAGIYFTLKSEEDYGLTLPEWSSTIYPEILEEAAAVDYEFSTANSNLKKYSAGFLLKKILDDSIAKKNGTFKKDTRIFLYSAHEFNVATMLRTLNVFYRHVPPFGATIFFEIHNIGGVFGLKLYYQDYSSKFPKLLTIPGCSSFCELDQVYELMKQNLPAEHEACIPSKELM